MPPAPKKGDREPRTVLLRRGDTLWGLAKDHHTTVTSLQRTNQLGRSTLIYAGEHLRLDPIGTSADQPNAKHTEPAPSSAGSHSASPAPTSNDTASPTPAHPKGP
uniref:LysM peptidoglycan-binding domain-containing protein n=1 Tax=Streptomyces chartreusis TaxID=1969 RepID=UPI003F4979AD